MLGALESLVSFLIGETFFAKLIRWIVTIFLTITAIFLFAIYKETHSFNLFYLFDKQFLYYILYKYKKVIYIFLIIENLFFIFLFLKLNKDIQQRKHCGVQYVALEELARLWLENEDYKKVVVQELQSEIQNEPQKEEINIIVPSFKTEIARSFFNEYILKHKDSFDEYSIRIIIDLLNLLEENPTPSVVSYFENDPNAQEYKKNMVTQELTSYDILKKIDLLSHTINVAKTAYEIINKELKEEANLYFSRVIIASLAHDIGKIRKAEEKFRGVSLEIFKKQPHHIISRIMFMEKYPDFKLKDEIVEAIEKHHSHFKDENNLTLKYLIKADKEARKREIEQFLIENKIRKENEEKQNENKTEENKTEVSENKTKTKPKQNDTASSVDVDNNSKPAQAFENEEDESEFKVNVNLDEEEGTGSLPTYEENKSINHIKDFEYSFDKVFERYKEELVKKPCLINPNDKGIDLDFVIPYEDMIFISLKHTEKILNSIGIPKNEVKSFIKECISKKIFVFTDIKRGFYITSAIINLHGKELKIIGNFMPIKHLNITINEFQKIKEDCTILKKIEIKIPNFKE